MAGGEVVKKLLLKMMMIIIRRHNSCCCCCCCEWLPSSPSRVAFCFSGFLPPTFYRKGLGERQNHCAASRCTLLEGDSFSIHGFVFDERQRLWYSKKTKTNFGVDVCGYGFFPGQRPRRNALFQSHGYVGGINTGQCEKTASVCKAESGKLISEESTGTGYDDATRIAPSEALDSPNQILSSHFEEAGGESCMLSSDHSKVLEAISQGKSVFITGAAGTGKTLLLNQVVQLLRKIYGDEFVVVTASTGIAACHLGGTTLHSFAGVGPENKTRQAFARYVWSKKSLRNNWLKAKALVIDEISMIDKKLFEDVEYVARMVRAAADKGEVRVFGGLQLVVAGDFFQLPPVTNKDFAFEANCWGECFDLEVNLSHVFRQPDMEFIRILNEVRVGQCSPQSIQRLLSCERPLLDCGLGLSATKLYPLKMQARVENERQLKALGGEILTYVSMDKIYDDRAASRFEKMMVQDKLHLSVGAQVMLVKNINVQTGLVNGSRGVVVRFAPSLDATSKRFEYIISPNVLWPVIRFACDGQERLIGPNLWKLQQNGQSIGERQQLPLVLAWALSVHKCQGMTLDNVETDLSEAFDYGQVYVALSRVRSIEGLRLVGFSPSKIRVHPKVLNYYEKFSSIPQ